MQSLHTAKTKTKSILSFEVKMMDVNFSKSTTNAPKLWPGSSTYIGLASKKEFKLIDSRSMESLRQNYETCMIPANYLGPANST
jgi:hypothetical protein